MEPLNIQPNQSILVRLPSQNIKVVKVEPGSIISLGKFGSFKADDIIGDPFGFTYEIGADMELSLVDVSIECDEDDQMGAEQTMTGHKITATGLQQLTSEEIEALKSQGVSGAEIIARVTEGHTAFEHKTEYSKEKYLKRKKQKFLQQFTPYAIGSTELIDIYLDKDPTRIYNISPETLALALSMGNIRPGGNYLVADETPGVLVAAMLERIGGEGSITVVHENEHPNLDCLKYLSVSDEDRERLIKTINWLELFHPEETEPIRPKTPEELESLKPAHRRQYFRAQQREKTHKWILDRAQNEGFDALMVMTQLDLPSLIPRLLQFVSGSRPIVLYSEFKEVLVETTLALQKNNRVLAPTIMETRVRKYQTLPGRIHPLMSSRGYGGYLLSALRVHPNPAVNAVGKISNRRKKPKLSESDAATSATETPEEGVMSTASPHPETETSDAA